MESQFQSQPVVAVHQYPDEVPDELAREIQDGLNRLSWTPNRDIQFATDIHRFLTDYAIGARCLAYILKCRILLFSNTSIVLRTIDHMEQ